MATLLGRSVASSYTELLKVNASGLSENLATIEDGAGVASPVQLSSTRVAITSAATAGFQVFAPTTFSSTVNFTGNATFSSLTLSGLGTNATPLQNAYFRFIEVNADGSLASGGTLNKVTLSNVTLSGLASDLGVADGGTGASTFTSKGVLYGNGASALQATAAGTDGQVLVANATGTPVFATKSPTITVEGDVTGAVTLTNLGSATLTLSIPAGQITDVDISGTLSESKIPTLTTAGKVSGSAITSGTLGGNVSLNTTGTITSGAITSSGLVSTSGNISATGSITGGTGSFSGLTIRGSNRNFSFPTADGNSGQVLTTNGGGVLTWVNQAAGGGGGGGGLASVSADPAPLLGGNLDVGGFSIVSSVNGNINISPNGTGTTIISKVATPSASTDAANKGYVDSTITAASSTAQYNASKIRGVDVSSTLPNLNGQVLAYNLAANRYEPSAVNASGFWGFKVENNHLKADTGADMNFVSSDYFESAFAPFSSVTINSSGHVVATF